MVRIDTDIARESVYIRRIRENPCPNQGSLSSYYACRIVKVSSAQIRLGLSSTLKSSRKREAL